MNALHKLLAGTILVALAAFGLTALTSSSTNSGDTRVWGWLNTTCNSEWSMIFQTMGEMLEFSGTELYGVTWDFESYYRAAEVDDTGNFGQCHLVSDFDPEIVVRGTPWTWNPGGGGGSGGVGSQQPGEPGDGGGPEIENPPPPNEFDATKAGELKNCLQNKLAALDLKTVEDMVEEDLGCFSQLGLNNLKFKKTDYRWRVSAREDGVMGLTIHNVGVDSLDNTVTLYPARIRARVKQFSYRGMTFKNLSTNAGLDELVHAIQGTNAVLADENWTDAKPYEKYNLQVQANVYSYIWYKQLHNNNEPPLEIYDKNIINKWRDKDCNLKENSQFFKKKARYQELEAKKEAGTLIYEVNDKGKVIKDEAAEMREVADWFMSNLPPTKFNGGYDADADLGCTEKDKKP
ncbi:MAG: hypothetical protein OXH31_02385 [Gammaproteobacteria bacterium]|nr:hypothetical protein [Gammaproteobacteria bacterium]